MSSQITPNSINQNYPVAGVDNNSQGFRDNFTSIKNNFTVSQREINDLMDKVVVKSPLIYGSTPSSTSNDFNNEQIANAVFVGCSLATTSETTQTTTGTLTLDYSTGSYHSVTLNGASQTTTLAFSNWPDSGQYAELRLKVTVSNATHILALPGSITLQYTEAISGYSGSTSRLISYATTGTHEYRFATADNGTTVTVTEVGRPVAYNAVLTANAVTTSSTFANIGNATVGSLQFNAAANQQYRFEALLPIKHSVATTDKHCVSVNFSAGTCYYMVEQQAADTGNLAQAAATTANSDASNVTTTSSNIKMARVSGTFVHSADTTVSLSFKTSGNTFTVLKGASIIATPLLIS